MRGLNFDVVHAHLPRAELLSMVFISSAKLITTKHNAETFLPNGPKLISRILARLTYVSVDFTICISEAVKNFLVEESELPESSPKTSVVHYGTPRNPLPGKSLRKLPSYSKNSSIKLGTVSRLEAQKDLSTLIRAFAKFKERYPFSTCEIVGAGSQLNTLQNLVTELGITDSVKFLGRTALIHEKISSWDLFILTSRYEGFGMVLLEALQCGRPIVASNNSAIPEVLGQDYPWLFNTGESSDLLQKILDLVQNSDNFDFLEFAEKRLILFEPKKMVLALDVFYRGVI
jgi:glycosyltransferase involved in cell wall biosynthesis